MKILRVKVLFLLLTFLVFQSVAFAEPVKMINPKFLKLKIDYAKFARIPSSSVTLAVDLRSQQTRMWCWAASAQMIMSYMGTNVNQCIQANNRFSRTDCCTISPCPSPPNSHPCVTGGWPEFGKYGFTFNTSGALSWAALKGQIDAGKPIAFSWGWDGGGGHMMVVNGYKTWGPFSWVHVLDPWAPCNGDSYYITYDAFVDGSGYSHWTDYYNITKTVPGAMKMAPKPLLAQLPQTPDEPVYIARNLVDEKNFRQFGFNSVQEAADATPGIPFQEFVVRLDELKKYQANPNSLIRPTQRLVYPLMVSGQVRSALTRVKSGTQERTESLGGANFIRLLSQVRTTAARSSGLSTEKHFLVKIPALQMFFVGYRVGNQLMLAPAMDDSRFEFRNGVGMPAARVFKLLAPEANRHDGSPG